MIAAGARAIFPNPRRALSCWLVATGVLLLTNWPRGGWGDYLVAGGQTVTRRLNGWLASLSQVPLFDQVVLIIFWGAVGLLLYWLYLRLSNSLVAVQNTITLETYRNRGDRGRRRRYWAGRVGALVGFGLALAVTWYLWPGWSQLFRAMMAAFSLPTAAAALLATLAAGLNLYWLWLAANLVLRRDYRGPQPQA